MLYPLKFTPLLKEVLWGGERLAKAGKPLPRGANPKSIGESWELSGVEGSESVVAEGDLADNSLSELIEVYMGELVGDKNYEKYGLEFPVLLKFIDTRERLSVQVHPSDEFARQMHSSRGKSEMWYIVDAEEGGAIYLDLRHPLSEEEYDRAVEEGTIAEHLNRIPVRKGEAYFVPAGTIHAIDGGIFLAEIQENSDITYRIHDWNRLDRKGHPRELHTALAAEVARLEPQEGLCITKPSVRNQAVEMLSCEQFSVNLVEVNGIVEADYAPLDSFVAFMCIEGEVSVRAMGHDVHLAALETTLIPAEATDLTLKGKGKLLEVFIK